MRAEAKAEAAPLPGVGGAAAGAGENSDQSAGQVQQVTDPMSIVQPLSHRCQPMHTNRATTTAKRNLITISNSSVITMLTVEPKLLLVQVVEETPSMNSMKTRFVNCSTCWTGQSWVCCQCTHHRSFVQREPHSAGCAAPTHGHHPARRGLEIVLSLKELITTNIRPVLQADGGDIRFGISRRRRKGR